MKFKITMKDPDGFGDSLQDAAKEMAEQVTGVDEEEREALIEYKQEKLSEICKKWFEYSEYLTVEIDTEAETCVVVPN
jgi:hypothetical protein